MRILQGITHWHVDINNIYIHLGSLMMTWPVNQRYFFDIFMKLVSFDRPFSLCTDKSKKQDSVFGIYILSTIHVFLKYTQASTNILSH